MTVSSTTAADKEKNFPPAAPHPQVSSADAIWCIHYECYKHLKVCGRCRIRIKCRSYQDYYSPRFDF